MLKLATTSKVMQLKNMTLNEAEAWAKDSGRSILDISPELQAAFVDMLTNEKDEKLKVRIKGVLCNQIYKQKPYVIKT